MFALNLLLSDQSATADCPLGLSTMERYCREALEQQEIIELCGVQNVEISVQLLSCDDMRALNSQYRQKDSATNVLSFESGLPVLNESESSSLLVLGDIVFCPEIIQMESLQQDKSPEQHWLHLLVHGTLHLCGYDHVEPDQAARMEELEIQILCRNGISNPYQMQSVQ